MEFNTAIVHIDYDETESKGWSHAYEGVSLRLLGNVQTLTIQFHSGNPREDWQSMLNFVELNQIPEEIIYHSSTVWQFGRDWSEFNDITS